MLLILLIAASGCVTSGKTVIKSKVLITESEEGVPEIVSIDVSTETVSALRKYQESSMCIPGVYMKCIQSTGGIGGYQIDYWRSVFPITFRSYFGAPRTYSCTWTLPFLWTKLAA